MSTPEQIKINGRALKCPHCANDTFHTRESLLNTSGMEFLDLGWLNQPAQNYICSQCGRIEWFIPKDSTSRYALRNPRNVFPATPDSRGQNKLPSLRLDLRANRAGSPLISTET